jgi:HlyD family secretion protein
MRKRNLATAGVAVLMGAITLSVWLAHSGQGTSAQDGAKPATPLVSRGYTDAPAGTVVIAGEPGGGSVLVELRIVDGQKVKRDEIIAVLSNYSKADVSVRSSEATLLKTKQQREAMVSGFRVAEIAMQEVVVKLETETNKLKALQLQRSGLPPDQKQLEVNIAQQNLEKEQMKLRVQKETLASDLAQIDTEITSLSARLDSAKVTREQSLVRTPIDGIVIQIYSRQGERVSPSGIAKIVDLSKLLILADVDELQVGRVVPGGKVEVTFRGSPTVYKGKVSRVAPTVKRMQRVEPDGGSSTDGRVVQVEVELDDPASMPQVLGRETRVIFP